MVRLAEHVLYGLVRCFYRTEVALSRSMKNALSDPTAHFEYRASEYEKVVGAARRYGVEIAGRDVLDLGCNDGALTARYLEAVPKRLVGVDIDSEAVALAREKWRGTGIDFRVGDVDRIPLEDESIDTILCFDVFEHVAQPARILAECRRVLRSGGRMLIGTWGWRHPFAPHLWSTMPVPWAHVLFGERTVLRTCRRVYYSDWYVPTVHDVDADGRRIPDRYANESISTDYLNKHLIADFERLFAASGLSAEVHLQPFGSKYCRWTSMLLTVPWVREFLTGYVWAVLTRP